MNVLITGVTETHTNHPDRASSTKFVSIPELMRNALMHLGHNVDHRTVSLGEDLSAYNAVFVYVYPLDNNAITVQNAIYALEQRKDAYICLDDWSFQNVLPTWSQHCDTALLTNRKWVAPLFPWGDVSKMNLPVSKILTWDPSSLYTVPPVHQLSFKQRKKEWYNASLSKDAHEWAMSKNLTWPIHAVGGKALGQPRMLEKDIVWEYGTYAGVLCPSYKHAGCGWWRVRYIHSAFANCVLGGDVEELSIIGKPYSYTLHELEQMDVMDLYVIATQQHDTLYKALQWIDRTPVYNKLSSFIYDSDLGRA